MRSAMVWEGPGYGSSPACAAVSGLDRGSDNAKTGRMAQLWILPVRDRKDRAAVCPAVCPFRSGGCYVDPRAVTGVWKTLPKLPRVDVAELRIGALDEGIRFGAVGDPSILPLDLLTSLASRFGVWTGYSHDWRNIAPAYASFLMASVEDESSARQAWALGYRTFRAVLPGARLLPGEILCPAAAGRQVTCSRCKLCNGNGRPGQGVANPVHGFQIRKAIAAVGNAIGS